MHAFSIVTLGIFVAGYSTARWDLVTRLYELSIFAWDHGVLIRAAKGFALLSVFFILLVLPVARIAASETDLVSLADHTRSQHEADRYSILESPVVASLRASSSSAEGPSSGVAGWGYGHTQWTDARVLAIRRASWLYTRRSGGLPKLRHRCLRRWHPGRGRGAFRSFVTAMPHILICDSFDTSRTLW
jgi:hypothetical protein